VYRESRFEWSTYSLIDAMCEMRQDGAVGLTVTENCPPAKTAKVTLINETREIPMPKFEEEGL
jgi:hypothetical protein